METQTITRGQVLRYVFMPQILPRLREITGSGFGHLAYFMALVFRAANILPPHHAYLRPAAIGNYGMMNVLSEVSNHLVIRRKNIDQVIVFFAILAGIVILFLQFLLLLVAFLINPASAASALPDNLFVTTNPEEDIAFRLLDRVFGIPDMFGSKDMDKIGEFHDALHGLFQFYSIALLVVTVLIALYFVFAIVVETAQTGTPFGKRFNHVWAPIRFVVAIGLLIPVGYGLNSAQWITLYAAKFGSGFATNGWIKFNDTLADSYLLGDKETLVPEPNAPELSALVEFIMIARTCKHAEEKKHIKPTGGKGIEAYLVTNPAEGPGVRLGTYEAALEYFHKGDIRIRFGQLHGITYTGFKGYVFPYCGEMVLQTTDINEPGSIEIQEFYFELIKELWDGTGTGEVEGLYETLEIDTHAQHFIERYIVHKDQDPEAAWPPNDYKETVQVELKDKIDEAITAAVESQMNSETWEKDREKIAAWGWGGAGVWYNRVAQINGALVTAVMNVPRAKLYPSTMEWTRQEHYQQDKTTPYETRFSPNLSDGDLVEYLNLGDENIANTLDKVYKYWNDEGFRNDPLAGHTRLTGNIAIDTINLILGTHGLFDICKNAATHPLAQLSQVGKGLMEAAIRNLGLSAGAGVAGGLGSLLGPHFGAALGAASSFFGTMASIGIMLGFILFYIVPFMPFLYFFFAVGGWIKGLFEAMVGVPLWALAHLRIDGEGLPGEAAINGYFLIFEIFIRPILIVFGLLASISIFSAMVKILNEIFYLVVSNLSGFNPDTAATCKEGPAVGATPGSKEFFRGPIDEFFFTVIYTIIVYMMGMSSFKLIDLIPNNILRWMGSGVASFGDQAGEPAEGLVMKMSVGGSAMGGSLKEAVGQGSQAVQGGLAAFQGNKG